MAKYIDKSAVVAEIKSLRRTTFTNFDEGVNAAVQTILEIIDTLEAKKVDLEKEVDKWYNNKAPKEFENVLYSDIEKFAKHFFELGIKAQKGK